MATQAHCAYCFDILASHLEKRKPLTLPQVEKLWSQFNAEAAAPDDELTEDDNGANENIAPTASTTDGSPYRPAAVSRLLAPSPGSSSSSNVSVQSAASTPSGVSSASSATSKSSSRTSFAPDQQLPASPLFVTWNVIQRDGEKRLRGCIGTFQAQELADGLRSYALTSALEDTRFNPITSRELPTLECGVTLLTDFEPIADPLDWTLGIHGLRISFTYHGRRYGSTYLPDVAREQGWTKTETLVSLMRKAGWSGRKDEWNKVELNVVRYQGRQVKLRWAEWEEWRKGVEGVEA